MKYEMDLLSRMQLSLLPEKPPVVDGLDLAVKTVLASEAGGDLFDFVLDDAGMLWIAAGDVSGHGYSCGIQQAMVMASLASLVKSGRRPSDILVEIDRVLRTGRSGRLFTSLALLCLDPKTGGGLLANAGHPYRCSSARAAAARSRARPSARAEGEAHVRASPSSSRRAASSSSRRTASTRDPTSSTHRTGTTARATS